MLGIIEGYYGRAWSWEERVANVEFLAPRGFSFYLYAPKADPHLRRLWREPHPQHLVEPLANLAEQCSAHGMRFGIGLSPTKISQTFDDAAKAALASKLDFMEEIGAVDVAILFDDMRGDLPDLAAHQMEIVHWVAERTRATRVMMCPSYYTDDPVLDKVFGERPPGYLEQLGAGLDPAVEIMWTGEEVCSRAFSVGHLERVANTIRRKPFLWDNYPVNDGERMSQHLHLRGFTGRPAVMQDLISAHGINPALQPTLTRIPALTLVESYRAGDRYEYGDAMRRAAIEVMGEQLGQRVYEDVLTLQDIGLDRLGPKADTLRERYAGFDNPGAREIIAWLDGEYRITDAIIQAQSGED